MKVLQMMAENFKSLAAVDITPQGDVTYISGANAAGKSTVLDMIWAGIDAAGYLKTTKTTKPIKSGEERGKITLMLGNSEVELIITRKFLPSGIKVEVDKPDGSTFKKPQEILDALTGAISFDPLGFANLDAKKQRAQLLELVDVGLDLEQWQADRDAVFSARTDKNRQLKEKEALFLSFAEPAEDTPDVETPASEIIGRMNAAQQTIRENEEKRRNLANLKRRMEEDLSEEKAETARLQERAQDHRTRAAEIERQIEELHRRLDAARKDEAAVNGLIAESTRKAGRLHDDLAQFDGSALAREVAALVDPDIDGLQQELVTLDETNNAVRDKLARAAAYREYTELKTAADAMTATLEKMDKNRDEAIKAAKFPVEGLGFDDSGVTFKGLPFSQASSAERLRVSLAIAIALNPRLRVLRISDGSLLDSKNMAIIREMCKEHDYQAWIEVVDESGKMGIYIEDGQVVNAAAAGE